MNQLEALNRVTGIVADTGDIESIRKYTPEDATTNPSLILKAAKMAEYAALVDDAVAYAIKQETRPDARLECALDKVAVNFGAAITKIVPGLVSTEVDARLSFDAEAMYQKGKRIIQLYNEMGISKERVLIKLATTWEGCRAAERLEAEGIHCNMTLLFDKCQAVAAANAKATLISPFVGRIYDWYKKATGKSSFSPHEDPGVLSVSGIYQYYKRAGIPTIIMGASFRNKGQITELAGCDKLTIAPKLLGELKASTDPLPRKLVTDGRVDPSTAETLDEKTFRWRLNESPMATQKLAEGIAAFAKDTLKLEKLLTGRIQQRARL